MDTKLLITNKITVEKNTIIKVRCKEYISYIKCI